MLSLLSALRVTILPSNRLFLQKVGNKKAVTKFYNFTESKKRGWRSYPLEFNLPSLSWTSFKGIQNLGPYFAHLRKRKNAYHTKMIFWEKCVSVFENWRSYPNWRYLSCSLTFHSWNTCNVPGSMTLKWRKTWAWSPTRLWRRATATPGSSQQTARWGLIPLMVF